MEKKIAFCITGWHYSTDFYSKLPNNQGIDIYIISHKPIKEIPDDILQSFNHENILIKPNVGYDWGCFQQFLETDLWKKYEYIFFMHDDIEILNNNFIDACITLLDNGYKIVGNGRPFDKRDWPRTHLKYYAHSSWKPNTSDFEHDIVRGSFFATKRDYLEKIGSFEVFWDKFKLNIGFGNNSLLATCGKFAAVLGQNAYGYLSSDYRSSEYIYELERGQQNHDEKSPKNERRLFNLFFMSWFGWLCEAYTRSMIDKNDQNPITIEQKFMKFVIDIFAKR